MNERQKRLAFILLSQENPQSAHVLAKKMKVSDKTIYSDIKMIQNVFKDYDIDVLSEPGIGIYLSGEDNEKNKAKEKFDSMFPLDQFSPEFRRLFIIKKALLEDENISLDQLSEEFYVSKSSIYNDLKIINKYLKSYSDIQIKVNESNILADGDELLIQKAIKNFFMTMFSEQVNTTFEEFTKSLFNEETRCIVNEIKSPEIGLFNNIDYYYRYSLEMSLLILFQRYFLGFTASLPKEYMNLITDQQIKSSTQVIKKVFERTKFDLQDKLIEHLSYLIIAHNIFNLANFDSEYGEIINKVLEEMEDIENVSFTSNKQLFNSLINHFPAMVLRLKMDIRISNPLTSKIKKEYNELFLELYFALSVVEDKFNILLNDDEVSLILIYFQIALEYNYKRHNILIIYRKGLHNQQLILSRIKPIISDKDFLLSVSSEEVCNIDLENFDLIVNADDNLNETLKKFHHVNINYLVTETDYVDVVLAYANQIIFKSNFEDIRLTNFIEEDLLFVSEESIERFGILSLMINKLIKRDYVDNEFKDSVVQREILSSTYLDNGVAMPHGNPSSVKKSSVSFIVFKEPIRWGDEQVKLVILLSISDKDKKFVKGIIQKVYKLVSDREMLEKIFSVRSNKILYQIISRI